MLKEPTSSRTLNRKTSPPSATCSRWSVGCRQMGTGL